jgi:hypothetical protein
MSPEQVRGLEVDARTDIFSLGVVLYEMVTGRPPFEGSSVSDAIVAVLHQEPSPLTQCCPIAPIELQHAVTKALQKDREQRYQSMGDLLIDLKRIRQRLESHDVVSLPESGAVNDETPTARMAPKGIATAEGGITSVPGSTDSPTLTANAGPTLTRDVRVPSTLIPKVSPVGKEDGDLTTTRDAETVPPARAGITHWITWQRAAFVIAIVVLLLAGDVIYKRFASKEAKPPISFQEVRMVRLTEGGNVTRASVSPDGKYAVYAASTGGQESLWVKQLATGSAVQIAPPSPVNHGGLTFSRDGNFVYCLVFTPGSLGGHSTRVGTLYEVATLGGTPKKVIDDIDSPVAISPDGRTFAFVRANSQDDKSGPAEDSLMIADGDGGKPANCLHADGLIE